MCLQHVIDVGFAMKLNIVARLDNVNAIKTTAHTKTGSGGRFVDVGNNLVIHIMVMAGDGVVVNHVTDENKMPVNLAMIEIALLSGGL